METVVHLTLILCYIILAWVTIEGLKIWLQYTNTQQGYKEAKKEFKAHCLAKKRAAYDKNFKLRLEL